jgi:hypothetical protein
MTKEPAQEPDGTGRENPAREPGKKKRLADALRRNLAKRKDKKAVVPQGDQGAQIFCPGTPCREVKEAFDSSPAEAEAPKRIGEPRRLGK